MIPHKCPVCEGQRKVEMWNPRFTAPAVLECRACHGTGIVWEVESEAKKAAAGGGLPLEEA